MSPTETLHDAAEATREYAKGIDRATAIRRLFAFWMAFTIVVSLVPPGVLYLGGPDVSPFGVAKAESPLPIVIDNWEDGTNETPTNGNWSYRLVQNDWDVTTTNAINGTYSGYGTNNARVDIKSDNDLGDDTGIEFYFNLTSYSSGAFYIALNDRGGAGELTKLRILSDGDLSNTASGNFASNAVDFGKPQHIRIDDIDFNDQTYDVYVNGTKVDDDLVFSGGSTSTWNEVTLNDNTGSGIEARIDNLNVIKNLIKVSGTVTFAENGTAVEGASITVNASDASDTTDASGFYSLGLDNGTYEITATKGDLSNSITVTVSGSDLTNQNITLTDETLSLDVPTHMFPNETASYEVTLEGSDVTDQANVTSSDPTNLTVNEATNELEATSDVSFAGEITITAEHDGLTASRNVTVANLSASNVALMQNAADMTAAIWGDVQGPDGTRPGGTQLTMRVLFVALLIGAAIATHASGFAGIGGITLIVVMGWFMGWVSDGMALVTVFTGLFIGLNLAANIDYSVRSD